MKTQLPIPRKFTLVLALAVALVTISGPTSATYSFQGVDFTWSLDLLDPHIFTLRMQNALDADPDWADAVALDNIGFKDLGVDFQASGASASLSVDPSGGYPGGTSAWTNVQGELNANGCKDPNGQTGVMCFDATPPLALTNDMLFTVTITSALLAIDNDMGPHLKLRFLDIDGNKEGSLLSKNLGSPDPGPGPGPGPIPVPAPVPLALIGLGGVLLGLTRWRFFR